MKIFSIVGARPQFIKMATLSREFRNNDQVEHKILHTGQHFDQGMSEVFFKQMQIPKADRNLAINSLSHGAMTGRMMEEIEKVFIAEKPDAVIVYGDTNSTLAGAMVARKMHILLAHVEAGLRSFNMKMPEEVNRILTDRIADILYCPSKVAVDNLHKEGFKNFPVEIVLAGDVMYDAVKFYRHLAERNSVKPFNDLTLPDRFILCTVHRQENTDDPSRLSEIVSAINQIAGFRDVVVPLHPRTAKILDRLELNLKATLLPPVGYFEMLILLKRCSLVMTDSGGLQKEAFFFHKPCITLRDETEWTELVDLGMNTLVGADAQQILHAFHEVQSKTPKAYPEIYGNGHAAKIIAEHLIGKLH